MPDSSMNIRPFLPGDEDAVVALWQRCNLTRPQNDARKDIARKMQVNPELFLVGVIDGEVMATAVGGYEGHRGWVNYLGVAPECRGKGCGRRMMEVVEEKMRSLGAPKINLQIRSDNLGAIGFYEAIGYTIDPVTSMGKRLVED